LQLSSQVSQLICDLHIGLERAGQHRRIGEIVGVYRRNKPPKIPFQDERCSQHGKLHGFPSSPSNPAMSVRLFMGLLYSVLLWACVGVPDLVPRCGTPNPQHTQVHLQGSCRLTRIRTIFYSHRPQPLSSPDRCADCCNHGNKRAAAAYFA
jgi:hypothetical protein